MPKLQVLITSTRPGRAAKPIADWFFERATRHGGFDVELVDLAEVGLPFLDEPKHPRLGKYEHQHTKDWSAKVAAADAFAFVTPEYNYGMPAPLKNALDFLHAEWQHKPVGFVSYGGVSGGTRSVQMTKQVVTTLRMLPVADAVAIPFFFKHLQDGRFVSEPGIDEAADAMLDELVAAEAVLRVRRGLPA